MRLHLRKLIWRQECVKERDGMIDKHSFVFCACDSSFTCPRYRVSVKYQLICSVILWCLLVSQLPAIYSTSDLISSCLLFQLLYYSAHYPTMFSLFSALGLNKAPDSPLRRIPYYASLVLIELLRDSNNGKFIVQFSFKNGLEVSVEATIFSLASQ